MKNTIQLLPIALLALILLLSHTSYENKGVLTVEDAPFLKMDSVKFEYTPEAKAIIDQKCYDCHSPAGDDEEAKEELLWDELPKLDANDQVYALDDIIESIKKEEMPPPKYIKRHPEFKLSEKEAQILMEWADALATKLYE